MKYNNFNRRHFLQGLGGFTLALPFIPSLLSKKALADMAQENQSCLVFMYSDHGGMRPQNCYPEIARGYLGPYPGLNQLSIFPQQTNGSLTTPAHNIHYGILSQLMSTDPISGQQQIAHLYGPELSQFVEKINLIRGLCIPAQWHGHQRGIFGNNFASNNHTHHDLLTPMKTVDQVLADASSFYSADQLLNVRTRHLNISAGANISQNENGINNTNNTNTVSRLFTSIFGENFGGPSNTHPNTAVMDKVLDDYHRLMASNGYVGSRVSSEDRQRLQQYFDQLSEVDRRINASVACNISVMNQTTRPDRSVDNTFSGWEQSWRDFADLISLAFSCGATRIVSFSQPINLTAEANYHHEVAHRLSEADKLAIHSGNARHFGEKFVARLASNLDAIDMGDSKTLLDKSLLTWTQEACDMDTHQNVSIPTICVGGLDGKLNTNNYVDYRNLSNLGARENSQTNGQYLYRPGIPMNWLLSNILQASGLARSEFERGYLASGGATRPGYGDTYILTSRYNRDGYESFPSVMMNGLSNRLPIIGNF
jgi:hypothetical protein